MELTVIERMKLLEILPANENILTLKIVRKLRETLSYSEDELKLMGVKYEFVCPKEGCGNKGFFPTAPKCGECGTLMVASGQMTMDLTPEMQAKTKEIHMGPQAITIASDALKRANEMKPSPLTELHISLWDKFFPDDEVPEELKVEIPKAIEKSMSE